MLCAPLALLGLPVALVLVEAVSFDVRNRNNGTIVSSGEKREYLLHVPRSYDRAEADAARHQHARRGGVAGRSDGHRASGTRLADEQGSSSSTRRGSSGRGPRTWRVGRGAGLAKDVRFISELIDTLKAAYNIDPARVYANGLSNGGGMAFVLSCTLSDRIAAVGMVASAQFLPWNWCTDQRPVPMIAFHGTADRFDSVPRRQVVGGPRSRFPDIPTWTANWARRNRCATERRSNRRWRPTSPASNTRTAPTTRPWCSTRQGRRPYLARRRAAAGVVGRDHQPQHRRLEPDVGVLPGHPLAR